MKKRDRHTILATIIISLVVVALGISGTHSPWDGTVWDTVSPDIDQPIGNHYKELYDLRKGVAIRMDKEHETLASSSAGGVHKQGSARAFFQDAAPATQVDGSAFDSGDLGSLWFDTDATPDNQFNVLTATTPTWTPISTEVIAVLLASGRVFGSTLGVTGDFAVNTDKFTVTAASGNTLVAGDFAVNTDKLTVAGATGNTLVAGTLDVTGNTDPTSYEATNGGFKDEDTMSSDSATAVASQQSVKAYVDNQIVAHRDSTYSGGETHIWSDSTLVFKHGVLAYGDGTDDVVFAEVFTTAIISASVTSFRSGSSCRAANLSAYSTTGLSIATTGTDNLPTHYHWQVWGY